jgi:ParB-like chromosome segregation protein Spo0J
MREAWAAESGGDRCQPAAVWAAEADRGGFQGVVRAGNGTLAAAKSLGWTTIQVVRSELPATELTAFAIADNRTAELAEWEDEVLSKLLLQEDIGDVGFTSDEVDKLVGMPFEDELVGPLEITQTYEVVIECRDEGEQREIYKRMSAEGIKCRLLTL